MPSGGMDLAPPPVRVWKAVAGATLATLVHGVNWYSEGAGGFGQVPAIPNLIRVRAPSNPNRANERRLQQLYATTELPSKAELQRMFGTI